MSPIDRTAFNNLVDDDGSGTTGTPWNKQQIKTVILDPVDATLVMGQPVDIPFNAVNFTADSGTWTVTSGNQALYRYSVTGKTVVVSVAIDVSTVTGSPADLRVQVPPLGYGLRAVCAVRIVIGAATEEGHAYCLENTPYITVKRKSAAVWTSPAQLWFTMTYFLV